MKNILFILVNIFFILAAPSAWSTNYYASTTGSAGNAGSLASPWSLARALNENNAYSGNSPQAGAGDTLWVRGGTYVMTSFLPYVHGSSSSPLIIRNYNNERATIDVSADGGWMGYADYTWWWGLEFTEPTSPTSGLNSAINTNGLYQRYINCIVHDATGAGFADLSDAVGTQIIGCIVYYNGRRLAGNHDYGIYAQNVRPYQGSPVRKYYRDNIWWNNFGSYQLHLYSSGDSSSGDPTAGSVDSFTVSKNVIFSYSWFSGVINDWGSPTRRIAGFVCDSNYWWGSSAFSLLEQQNIAEGELGHTGAKYRGNYLMLGTAYFRSESINMTFTGNTLYGRYPKIGNGDMNPASYPGNTFYCSTSDPVTPPTGEMIILNQNPYEPRRANLIVYNWDQHATVQVKVTPTYSNGDTLQLRDVQDYWTIATTQVVTNDYITVPMNLTTIATPVTAPTSGSERHDDLYPQHTDSRFNAFVVYKNGSGTVPQPPPAPVANAATNITATGFSANWSASSGATGYYLDVSTSSGFGAGTFVSGYENRDVGNVLTYSVTGLSSSTVYYWRVRAANAGGSSASSSTMSVTTAVAAPPSPTLASPADGATGVVVSPTLSWNSATGATSYQVQVSASSGFGTTVYDQSNLTSTSQQVTGLSNSTVYYWRVRAANTAGTSSWSSSRSFTTIAAAPAAPTLSSPTDAATDIATSPTLAWNAVSGAVSYQVQVSTSSAFGTTVYDQSNITSTSQQVTGLSNSTVYYWRVRATNAGGTSAWSSSRSFTTAVAAPPSPTLASPADGATGVVVNPTLSWNSATGATSYQVQVSASSGFGTTVYDQSNLTSTSQQVTGLSNSTVYYWRVRATNAGGTSAWSSSRSFTTAVAAPPSPTLASPADGATGVVVNPTLSWNGATGATSYQVQVSASSGFGTTVYDQSNITSTSQQVTGLSNSTVYYWRVRATNAGGTSAWSSSRSFTTIAAAPAAPTLSSPTDAATDIATSPTLAWNAVSGAVSYQVQVSTSSAFGTTVYDQSGLTSTSQQVTGLSNSTVYYWRVRATNAGGTSAWSSSRSFTTTVPDVSVPTLTSPPDSATGVAVNPILSWNAVSGAVSYQVQVSTSSAFGTTVYDQSNITSTSQQVTGLSNSTVYYWRVRATNAGGTSAWSGSRSFTTIVGGPPSPTLASPPDGATGVAVNPTLSWNSATGATSYQVQVSTSSGFGTTVYDQGNLTSTSQQVTGLSNSTVYYWRVRATNAGGTSAWSSSRSFTTIVGGPPSPTLASPADGATGVAVNPMLSWNSATGSTSYQLQVSTSSAFGTTVYDQSGLTSTSQQVTGLSNSTVYYWRVRATNAGGTSAWSSSRSFTTIMGGPPSPTLASPADGATGVVVNPTLSWNGATGATSYQVQVSANSGFGTTVYDQGNLTSTSQQVTGLSNSTVYYWRVRAINAAGTSPWSSSHSFTTISAILAAPTPVAPSNGATGQPTSLSFSWTSVPGAVTYELQIGTDSLISVVVFQDSTVVSNSTSVSSLGEATNFFWRVAARNGMTRGAFSAVWRFSTETTTGKTAFPMDLQGQPPESKLADITTSKPPNANSAVLTVSIYDADAPDEGALYINRIDTVILFGMLANNSNDQRITTLKLNTRASSWASGVNTVEFVHLNTAGFTVESASLSFSSKPSMPKLRNPKKGSIPQASNVVVDWTSSQGANSYRCQVSTDSLFSGALIEIVTTDTFALFTSLAVTTKYFGRVRGENPTEVGEYSEPVSFVTSSSGTVVIPVPGSPLDYALEQNYPNPFNPSTTIQFDLLEGGYTTLRILNSLGEEITLLLSEFVGPGRHTIVWRADGFPSGVYLCELRTEGYRQARRMVLLK